MAPKDDSASDISRKIREAKAAIAFEDDPHRAAIEDNPDDVKVNAKTWASILFLAMSFGPPIGLSFMSVAAVIVDIANELDPVNGSNSKYMAWIVGAWSLATACSFSLAGPLSDIFGRRNPILIGNAVVIVGFILGAVAKSLPVLIAGETLIGLGTGLIFVAYAGVPEMLPNKWRSLGLGILEGGISIPWGIVSTLLGAAFATKATWRWLFYLSIIVQVIAFIGIALFYWPTAHPRGDFDKTIWQQMAEIDYIGLSIIISGLAVFLVGLTWADSTGHAWKSASVVAPIIIGFFFTCFGFAYEWKISKSPMFPWSLFRMFRPYTILLVVLFVSGMNFHAMAPLLPQGSLYMFTPDGIQIGLIALPNTVMQGVAGVLCPMFAHRIGHVKWQLVLAMFLQTVFIGASAAAVFPNDKVRYMILPALGVPMFLWCTILSYAIASLHVPHSLLGVAVGLLGTFRSSGGAVGNAIFNTIFKSKSNTFIGEEIAAVMAKEGIPMSLIGNVTQATYLYNVGVPSVVAFAGLPDITQSMIDALRVGIRSGYGHAFKIVFYATIPFSAVALFLSFFIEDPTKYMTNHVQFAMGEKKKSPANIAESGNATSQEGGVKGDEIKDNVQEKHSPASTPEPHA